MHRRVMKTVPRTMPVSLKVFQAKALDLYPTDLRDTINELNEWIA